MIPNSATPSSLLWAHQLKREHARLLARMKIVESAAAATAASAPSLATTELTSSAIKQMEEKVGLLEAYQIKTSKKNDALAETVTTEVVVLDKVLARVSMLEAVLMKSEGFDGELKRYKERLEGFVNDVEVMRKTITGLEAGKMREEDEGKKLVVRVEDINGMYKAMEDKLWALENAISNVEAGREEDRAFMKVIMRNINTVQDVVTRENAKASMVMQALQGLNDTDQVIKKRVEGLNQRVAEVEKRAEGLDVNITAVKSTEQTREPRRLLIPARDCLPADIVEDGGQDRSSNKTMVHVEATPIKDIRKIRAADVAGNSDKSSIPHIEASHVPHMHKNKAPHDFISQLRANPVRSLSKSSTQTESEIEATGANSQASHKSGWKHELEQMLSHQVVEPKTDCPPLMPLTAQHVNEQAKYDRPKANHVHVKHLAVQKELAGVIRSETSMQTRSREISDSPKVTRNPRPLPKRRTIALSPPGLSSTPPRSSSSKIEVGLKRRPEQSLQQQQRPQKHRRREILQTSPLS